MAPHDRVGFAALCKPLECQSSGDLDDLLAVVEHQEHPFVAQNESKPADGFSVEMLR